MCLKHHAAFGIASRVVPEQIFERLKQVFSLYRLPEQVEILLSVMGFISLAEKSQYLR